MSTSSDSAESDNEEIPPLPWYHRYEVEMGQNPVSHRRLARDIDEMVSKPYPNTRLIPNQDSIVLACLLLNTGVRIVHVPLIFEAGYPEKGPFSPTLGRGESFKCPASLLMGWWMEGLDEDTLAPHAYTIKTLAMHLLSMFEGDNERDALDDAACLEAWSAKFHRPHEPCETCRYPNIDPNIFRVPKAAGAGSPNQFKNIHELPNELLKDILAHLPVEDMVRFGQASEKVAGIIKTGMLIRDRELQCFVTKEHFTQSPLGIGVYLSDKPWRWAAMESEFDLISSDAFHRLGVRSTAYNCKFDRWLPLPLSQRHWEQVKSDAYASLQDLADECQSSPVRKLADPFDVLTAFMQDQVTKLFNSEPAADSDVESNGLLKPSEKGIESLFFLFHLLLCVAVENPEYVGKANNMIRVFEADNRPTGIMPCPTRVLAAMLISDVECNAGLSFKLFIEAFSCSVAKLLIEHPELEYLGHDEAASPYGLHRTFTSELTKYRALMFMNLFRQTVRSADLGNNITEKRDFFFGRRGLPPSAMLAKMAAELPRIMAVDSFPGFLDCMGMHLGEDKGFLEDVLRDIVRKCTSSEEWSRWQRGLAARS